MVKNPPARQETPVQFLGQEHPVEKGTGYPLQYSWASPVSQLVTNLPGNAGDLGSIPGLGRFLGGGHGNSLPYSCLENPGIEEPGGRKESMGSQRVGHD